MTDRDERFRRLTRPATGDLFEHFGLDSGGAEEGKRAVPAAASDGNPGGRWVQAHACSRCGWFVTDATGPCPTCGTPRTPTPGVPG